MTLSPSSISIGLLAATVVVLLFVTQCQRSQLSERNTAIEAAQARETALQEQLDISQATLEADRKRIIEIAHRFNQAITNYTTEAETANETHENRMSELAHIDSQESVDWLCEPVPDDVRRLFNCDTETDRSNGTDVPTASGSAQNAVPCAGNR